LWKDRNSDILCLDEKKGGEVIYKKVEGRLKELEVLGEYGDGRKKSRVGST